MIDGFKCSCVDLPAEVWQNNPLLDFGLSVSESTGELLSLRKEAKRAGLHFVISPTKEGYRSCSIFGSLHKYKNDNDHNRDQFTLSDVIKTLDGISRIYNIDLKKAVLHGLEIGVNIPLSYSPKRIIKSAICHRGKPFNNLLWYGKSLGVICEHTDYAVKLYDKGRQYQIENGGYILRYEVKCKRMRMLEAYGITCMEDLKDVGKISLVKSLLLSKLSEIVFFDFQFNPHSLTLKQRLKWERYSNPNYWENINRDQYYKARRVLVKLSRKYGAIQKGEMLSEKVSETYQNLIDVKQKKERRFPQLKGAYEAQKKATFSELEYVVENVAFRDEKNRYKKDKKNGGKNGSKKRYCVSCGRDISGQRKDSVFCSEKYYGQIAKKCRNKSSNHRRGIKQKIKKGIDKNLRMQITCRTSNGRDRTYIRKATKINISRSWLDYVKSAILLPQKVPKTIDCKPK